MTFKELRQQSGMTQKDFSEYFGMSKRAVESWEGGVRKCPEYLLHLMEYKLKKEKLAKWVKGEDLTEQKGIIYGHDTLYCSCCLHEAYWDSDYDQQEFDYCHNCGAKMDK